MGQAACCGRVFEVGRELPGGGPCMVTAAAQSCAASCSCGADCSDISIGAGGCSAGSGSGGRLP